MIETKNLIGNLVNIAHDYNNCEFDEEHVVKWLEQFPQVHHKVILRELNNILEKTYFSRDRVKDIVFELLNDREVIIGNIYDYKFINPQILGGSQRDMLNLVDEVLDEQFNLTLEECGTEDSTSFIYIDDALYSGNRLRRDIEQWVESIDDITKVERLCVLFLAAHERNLKFILDTISKLLPETEISIWTEVSFKDDVKRSNNLFEAYLPIENEAYTDNAIEYVERVDNTRSDSQRQYIPLFRKYGTYFNDQYFSNATNRNIVEKLFFEKGVSITNYAANPNPNMRAMGYDNSKTLGFGSYIITYRNIANNCPLVLWWGDLTATSGINNWYPLFPRITN